MCGSGDRQLSKHEFLVSLRKLFQFGPVVPRTAAEGYEIEIRLGELIWYDKARETVVELFDSLAGDDRRVDVRASLCCILPVSARALARVQLRLSCDAGVCTLVLTSALACTQIVEFERWIDKDWGTFLQKEPSS